MGFVEQHAEKLKVRYPQATVTPRPDGAALITVPGFALPTGWSKAATTIYFLAPLQYPTARPDCFWADPDLRLASGAMPQNAQFVQIAGLEDKLWFSYHPMVWDPQRDNLTTYLNIIDQRLHDLR